MPPWKHRITSGLLACGLAWICGCDGRTANSTAPTVPRTDAAASPASSTAVAATPDLAETNGDAHGHKAGAHGGIMISLGRNSYHVEAVFEKGGVLRLYTLGQDESRVIDVEHQSLTGFVRTEGQSDAEPFALEPAPQNGDTSGRTSQFVGTLPHGLWGQSLEVTVPNIVISGERFRLGFKSTPDQHDEGSPTTVADDAERQLYLTPGGKYTEADIKANGGVTATAKFKGLKSSHDMFPKPGDRICPITKTKANPQFTWIVDGNSYEFCCPPCVDEFVKTAKVTPDEIKHPSEYVKRQ